MASSELALRESSESRDKLTDLLEGCFVLQKMYGRAPESTATVERLFQTMLAPYPAGKVIRAFEAWLERSQEFPTPADIIGLIKRNGKPPLKESDIIAIRKKDGEDRDGTEWRMLREWDEQQSEGWDDVPSPEKDQATLQENIRLREEVKQLREETKKLAGLLEAEKNRKAPEPTLDEKIQRTVKWMRDTGAPELEINDFIATQSFTSQDSRPI